MMDPPFSRVYPLSTVVCGGTRGEKTREKRPFVLSKPNYSMGCTVTCGIPVSTNLPTDEAFIGRWCQIASKKPCHSVRQARERRKRLELGNLSRNPAG